VTVIAVSGGVIAHDRQITAGSRMHDGSKSALSTRGRLLVWNGPQDLGIAMANWYLKAADRCGIGGVCPDTAGPLPHGQTTEDWARLVVGELDGSVLMYEAAGFPVTLDPSKRYAFGQGADFALGAMHHGATPIDAVNIANRYSIYCGFGVTAFYFTARRWTPNHGTNTYDINNPSLCDGYIKMQD
jgi:hypothetical protein